VSFLSEACPTELSQIFLAFLWIMWIATAGSAANAMYGTPRQNLRSKLHSKLAHPVITGWGYQILLAFSFLIWAARKRNRRSFDNALLLYNILQQSSATTSSLQPSSSANTCAATLASGLATSPKQILLLLSLPMLPHTRRCS